MVLLFTTYFSLLPFIQDPEERLIYSYKSIGWPMLQASWSTLICAALMVLHRSYMMRVFIKTVLLVEVFGLVHSLIVLPIVLVSIHIYQLEKSILRSFG